MTSSHVATTPIARQPGASRSDIAFLEALLVLAGFAILMSTFKTLLSGQDADRTSGTLLFQLITAGIYLSSIVILISRGVPRWLFIVLLNALPLIVLILLPLLSTLWSLAPQATFRRAVALLLSSCFAAYIVVRFDLRSFFNIFMIAFLVFIAMAVVAALIPSLGGVRGGGYGAYGGAWQGLTGHKNQFGHTAALGAALLPAAAVAGLIERWKLAFLAGFIGLILLVLSQSATSLVAAFGSIAVGTTLYAAFGGRIGRLRVRPILGIPLVLIAAIAGFLVVKYGWTPILQALGRDTTLSGRTELWRYALRLNNGQEWLGAGYRAFWVDSNTRYFFESFPWWHTGGEETANTSYAGPSHSHSSYIDLRVELGIVGTLVFATVILSALFQLRRTLSRGNFQVGFIFAVILVFLLIHGVAEKSILQQSEDLWFLFTLFYLFSIKESILRKVTQGGYLS